MLTRKLALMSPDRIEGDHVGKQTVDPNESLYSLHRDYFGSFLGGGSWFCLGIQDRGRS